LGGKSQGSTMQGVVQRLDAQGIPGQQQASLAGVRKREGEYPVEPGESGRALILVRMDHNLGVRVRPEDVAPGLQIATEIGEVIDLPVVGELETAVFGRSEERRV